MIGKLLALPASDKWLVFKVSITLPLVESGLRLLGLQAVARLLASWSTPAAAPLESKREIERQARLLAMVVHRHPFAGKCLSRSLTLWWCLRRAGIKSEVRLGIRKDGGQLRGHAWVEYQGQPVAEPAGVCERYAVLVDPPLRHLIWSS
jgi:hypothetical protein